MKKIKIEKFELKDLSVKSLKEFLNKLPEDAEWYVREDLIGFWFGDCVVNGQYIEHEGAFITEHGMAQISLIEDKK